MNDNRNIIILLIDEHTCYNPWNSIFFRVTVFKQTITSRCQNIHDRNQIGSDSIIYWRQKNLYDNCHI